MRFAVIAVIVTLVLSFINSRLNKEKQARRNDPTISPDHFVITQAGGLITALYILCAVMGLAVSIGIILEGDSIGYALVGLIFVALGVYGLLGVYVWRIEVDGVQIKYHHTTGKVETFSISEITRVTAKQVNGAMEGCRYKFYSGERKLFSIDETTDPVYLIDRLQAMGVEIEAK